MNGIIMPLHTKNELIALVLGIILVLSSLLPWSTLHNASELIYVTDIEGVRKIVFILGFILIILTYFIEITYHQKDVFYNNWIP